LAGFPAFSRTFAQRALWAAAILARADGESFRVPVAFAYVLPNAASGDAVKLLGYTILFPLQQPDDSG
jgi:hypothetical protein